MRVAFLGTPEVATIPLRALVAAGHEVAPVITRPDKRRSRGGATSPSPVKAAALELGLPVSHDLDVDGAEIAVVAAYGRLIPSAVLRQSSFVNIHPSLLPRWRGAAPVERAILAGDERTGVCLMSLVEEMDAGPVYRRVETTIGKHETSAQLLEQLFTLGSQLLVDALQNGFGEPVPQNGEATYAKKLTSADFELDWHRPARELHRIIRLGRARTMFRGHRLRVLDAVPSSVDGLELVPGHFSGTSVGTGEGALSLRKVQPEGKAPVEAQAWLNGARLEAGERLG